MDKYFIKSMKLEINKKKFNKILKTLNKNQLTCVSMSLRYFS